MINFKVRKNAIDCPLPYPLTLANIAIPMPFMFTRNISWGDAHVSNIILIRTWNQSVKIENIWQENISQEEMKNESKSKVRQVWHAWGTARTCWTSKKVRDRWDEVPKMTGSLGLVWSMLKILAFAIGEMGIHCWDLMKRVTYHDLDIKGHAAVIEACEGRRYEDMC